MEQRVFPEAVAWAEANFGSVELGRESRRDRLVHTAARLALKPSGSLPSKLDWNELRAFYGLLHRSEATPEALLAGHKALTLQAMHTNEVILVIHDGTDLDFTSHKALQGIGPVGDGGGRGLLQHNSLAVRASDGMLLGLVHQQLVVRQPAPAGETRSQRAKRQRESILWQRGFEGIGRAPEGCCWVDVCDRGGDVFEALHSSRQLGHHALIRACQDRCVLVKRDGQQQPAHLLQLARSLPAKTSDTVEVSEKGGRPARQAQVKLASCPVLVEVPKNLPKWKQYQPIKAWVVRIWEENPPEGIEALEWVLLTTLPTQTKKELLTRRDWYAWRWTTAEDYHQAEKTGCGEEELRFRDVDSLRAALTVIAVVAVREIQLRQAARAYPQEPAEKVASPLEIAVVQQALGAPLATWTVREFTRGVAKLGGFIGRSCQEPGWKVLSRGYQRLHTMLDGIAVGEQLSQRSKHPQQPQPLKELKNHPKNPL
jgi:hypothetical protein